MKISCQSCAAKYTIANEKVVGKVIKIKCKKCSSTIVVNGNDPATLAQLQQEDGGENDAATQLVSTPAGGFAEGGNPDEWTVSTSDDDQRTMTTAQILSEYASGGLAADAYVWKDGMGDWLPLNQVPELMPLLAAAGSQSAGGAAPANNGYAPFGGGQPAAAAPAYEAAPAYGAAYEPAPQAAAPALAARRAGGRVGGDLFGGGSAPGAAASAVGGDKATGERNETSVLFSLKDLHAAESVAAGVPAKKSGGGRNADRVDDIFSLGGSSSSPMLAPPPMNAPVIEAPPPPPPPPSYAPPAAMAGPGYMPMAPPPKASPVPFIVAGVSVLALLAVVGFVVLGKKDDPKPADTAQASTTKATETAKAGDTAQPAETAKPNETAKPDETAAATATATTSAVADATTKPDATKPDGTKPDGTKPDKTKPAETAAAVTAKPAETAVPTAGGDQPFDRGAASAALGGAAGGAKACGKPGGPTGSSKVQVTFAPSGRVTQAVVGAPFAGTPVGSCIAGSFKSARVPPFSGAPVTVSKTVSIK